MKKSYRIELHAHTQETSPCACVAAPDLVERYLAKGYDGIVITDHLSPPYYTKWDKEQDWEGAVDHLLTGYKAVKKEAGDRLKVYLGMEIRFPESCNDYLVYGFDEDFLRSHPFLHHMSIMAFSALCKEKGYRIFQAHPFRYGMMLCNPAWIDGLEIFNNHPGHNSHNDFAFLWCKEHGLPSISGSDFHEPGGEGRGGILLPFLPSNDKELAEALFHPDKVLLRSN